MATKKQVIKSIHDTIGAKIGKWAHMFVEGKPCVAIAKTPSEEYIAYVGGQNRKGLYIPNMEALEQYREAINSKELERLVKYSKDM